MVKSESRSSACVRGCGLPHELVLLFVLDGAFVGESRAADASGTSHFSVMGFTLILGIPWRAAGHPQVPPLRRRRRHQQDAWSTVCWPASSPSCTWDRGWSGSPHLGWTSKPNSVSPSLATRVVAVASSPLGTGLQRLANRLIYGKRATPYEVLSEFSSQDGRRLSQPRTSCPGWPGPGRRDRGPVRRWCGWRGGP
jgi:hypothetical protein